VDPVTRSADPGKPQRILVTGGSGFIGRNVVAGLAGAGYRVRVVDLQPHPDPEVDIVVGDICDHDVLVEAFAPGIDGVVHLAAVTSVLKSVDHPGLTYRTNVAATADLMELCREHSVSPVVFASSSAVAGRFEAGAISETSPLRPLSPYGATKAAAEMLMSAYDASYGVRGAVLRLTNVYGPGMALKDSIVARLMRAVLAGTTFEIYGDGRQVRDYVHVSDVVEAVQAALTDPAWTGPASVGGGHSISVLEMVDRVRDVTGGRLPAVHGPARPGEMPAVIVDTAAARRRGWEPRVSLDEGLAGVWREWSSRSSA
jgi:UDP-glucose 4-epimerase